MNGTAPQARVARASAVLLLFAFGGLLSCSADPTPGTEGSDASPSDSTITDSRDAGDAVDVDSDGADARDSTITDSRDDGDAAGVDSSPGDSVGADARDSTLADSFVPDSPVDAADTGPPICAFDDLGSVFDECVLAP